MSTGYGVYKEDRITEILAAGAFDPEHLGPGYGVGLDERVVEYPWLFSRLPPGPGRLFDAGSVLNFDHLLTHPALRAKQIFISTLAPEAPRQQMRPNVSYVYEDLRETCYRNRYFDWVVCISTLEHVGLDNTRFYTSDLTGKEATGRSPAFSQRPASSATSDTRGTASGSHRDRPREKRPTSTTTPLAATTRTTPLRRAPWCA